MHAIRVIEHEFHIYFVSRNILVSYTGFKYTEGYRLLKLLFLVRFTLNLLTELYKEFPLRQIGSQMFLLKKIGKYKQAEDCQLKETG